MLKITEFICSLILVVAIITLLTIAWNVGNLWLAVLFAGVAIGLGLVSPKIVDYLVFITLGVPTGPRHKQ